MKKVALMMAGGTGGHIIPGLALAEGLKRQGWTIYWLGNPDAMEGRLVPAQNIPLLPMRFSGFRGKGILAQLKMPFRLWSALRQAKKHICSIQPDLVIGMGGYVALPGGLVARSMGIPLIVHEQNSIAGLTNKILARFARQVYVGFPNQLKQGLHIGNPLRKDFLTIPAPSTERSESQPRLKLLVVGGSLGAQALNQKIPEFLAALPVELRPTVIHQTGEKHLETAMQIYQQHQVQADVVPFIEDMVTAYQTADIVICRSGAMTVSEISALGVAALFVPFPAAVDDHQTTNAEFLVSQGAAWICQQKDLSVKWLVDWWQQLTPETLQTYRTKSYQLGKKDATDLLVTACERLLKEKNNEA